MLAAVSLAVIQPSESRAARKRALSHAMREVAHYLGNTAAVSRTSYVDPAVVEAFEDGETIAWALSELGDAGTGELATAGSIEEAVLKLLDSREAGH